MLRQAVQEAEAGRERQIGFILRWGVGSFGVVTVTDDSGLQSYRVTGCKQNSSAPGVRCSA